MENIKDKVSRIAQEEGLDPNLALRVASQESNFNQKAVSSKGASGVMQVMPNTFKEVMGGLGDLQNEDDNIRAGTRYLKTQLDNFGDERLALAAYNAGPGAVRKHGGVPPYAETQDYVNKISGSGEKVVGLLSQLGDDSLSVSKPASKQGGEKVLGLYSELYPQPETSKEAPPPAQAKKATAVDYAKQLGASAIDSVGTIFQGGGELVAKGLNMATGTEDFRSSNPLEPVSKFITDSMTDGGKQAMQDSSVKGDILKPSTWEFPKSKEGLAMLGAQAFGSLATWVIPGGLAAKGYAKAATISGALTGGLSTGGDAAGDARIGAETFMKDKSHEELMQEVPTYAAAFNEYGDEAQAKQSVINNAGLYASLISGSVGMIEGGIIGKQISKLKLPTVPSVGGIDNPLLRRSAGVLGGAVVEGAQEGLEKTGGNAGENLALGQDITQDVTRNTAGEVLGGALVGGPIGGLGAGRTIQSVQPQSQGQRIIDALKKRQNTTPPAPPVAQSESTQKNMAASDNVDSATYDNVSDDDLAAALSQSTLDEAGAPNVSQPNVDAGLDSETPAPGADNPAGSGADILPKGGSEPIYAGQTGDTAEPGQSDGGDILPGTGLQGGDAVDEVVDVSGVKFRKTANGYERVADQSVDATNMVNTAPKVTQDPANDTSATESNIDASANEAATSELNDLPEPTHAQKENRGGARNPISKEIKENAIKLYQSGKTQKEAGQELGISEAIVNRALRDANIPSRPFESIHNKLPEQTKKEAIRLYKDENMTLPEVAKRMQVGITTAARWMKESGVQRTQAEALAIAAGKGRRGPRGTVVPWQSAKTGQWEFADSKWEAVRMSQLDADESVKSWTKLTDTVPYIDSVGKSRVYRPDFRVEYADGRYEIEEIKPAFRVNDPNNKAKAEAASKYFGEKGIAYKFVTENEIGSDNINDFEPSGFAKITEDERHARRKKLKNEAAKKRRLRTSNQVVAVNDMIKPGLVQVARIGGKNSGESISVQRAGNKLAVLYNGDPLIDYDTEKEITVPVGASLADIKAAVKASGQFSKQLLTFNKEYAPPQAERAKDAKRNAGDDNSQDSKLTGSDSEADKADEVGAQDIVAQPAVKPEVKPESTTNIQDFGEKISGAKKDTWSAYKDKAEQSKSVDIASEPLSKSWPEPDYQKLLDAGADPYTVAFIHAARDEIPTKPGKSWKLKGWVDKVASSRKLSYSLLESGTSKAELKALTDGFMPDVIGRAALYEAVGHGKSLKGITLSQHSYTFHNGNKYDPAKVIWSVEGPSRRDVLSNWPKTYAEASTREEALNKFIEMWGKVAEAPTEKKEVEFGIWSKRLIPGFFIGKKIGKHIAELKTGFATAKEAREFMREKRDELQALYEKYKEIPSERRSANNVRIGSDYRDGADVSADQFSEAFGFRGVQFGNYVEGKRRQADLNNAYDSLMDLAGVLNIQPKSISLNGELGLAFGARGSGGKNPAAAHYESGHVVINLTKGSGAGSLAHEWFHAMDNYFSRNDGKSGGFLTESLKAGDAVRPEMVQAFNELMSTIRKTGLAQRSKELDKRRTKEYWGTGLEMAARSFESYVIAKMQDQNSSNDYLANIVSEEGFGLEEGYPYPTAAEIPAIRAAFDNMFQMIESKETDKGIALFSRQNSISGMEVEDVDRAVSAITDGWENAPKIIVVEDMTDSRIPERVRDDNERQLSQGADGSPAGFFDSGNVYIVATEMNSVDQIIKVVFHETLGHYGMRGVFGRSLNGILNDIYMARRADVLKKAKEYGLDINVRAERLLAAEEVLAEMAQTNPKIGFVKRAIAAIRTWLRNNTKYFKNLELTDAEIIRNILEPARNFVRNGRKDKAAAGMVTAFSRTNRKPSRDSGDTMLTAALEYLARDPELFQRPLTESKSIYDIASELDPGYRVTQLGKTMTADRKANRAWEVFVPGSDIRSGIIMTKDDEVWIDVSRLQSGQDRGSAIYDMAAAFAHNNGKVLIGDPEGLTRKALYRRNENMLSSALKYGTTKHLKPHLAQEVPAEYYTGHDAAWGKEQRALKWIEGDDVNNIKELVYNSWKSATANIPEINDVIYNPTSEQFETVDGEPFTKDDFDKLLSKHYGESNRQGGAGAIDRGSQPDSIVPAGKSNPYRAGSSTLKRAALFNTFLRSEGGEGRRQLLGKLVAELSRDGLAPALKRVMYSRTGNNSNDQGISKEALSKLGKRMSGGDSGTPGGTELTSLLNLFDTNQVVEMYSDALPELRTYKEIKNVEVANRNLLMDSADKLLKDLRKLPEAQRDTFANIAHEATIEQVDPTQAYRDTPDIKKLRDMVESLETKKDPLTPKAADLLRASKRRLAAKKLKHLELRNQFLGMSDKSQALFIELKNTYSATAERVFDEVQNRIDRMGIDSKSKGKIIAELRQEFDQVKQSVYFPLARFGDNVVIGTKETNGVPERVVEYYEKESIAKAAEARMRADGYSTKITSRKAAQQDNKAMESITDIISNIKDMKQPGEGADLNLLLDHVNQALIQMLPDQSYRRHFMHRKNVPGYSTDFIRAYSDSMWKAANHVSGLMHGDLITKSISDMQKRIDKTDGGNVATAQDVVNNLIKREELQSMPTSQVAALAGQFGFVSALGSASNFLLNLTQTPMLTFPWLGARYGFTKASLELSKALAQTVKSMETAKTLDEVAQVFDIRRSLKGDELAAMEMVYQYGKIDLTQAYDLIDAANKDSANYDSKMQKIMRFAALPQHLSENINRQVSALATIRLALKQGVSPMFAARTAMTALDETHFNYEKWNRPPIMQGNVQRVLFMFKQYAQKVAYLYTKLALTAATKPEERKVAIKQLASMFAMQAGLGGILSLPIFGEAMVLGAGVAGYKIGGKKGAYAGAALGLFLAMLSAIDDDDDKEEFDTAVRNFMADSLGKDAGEAITRGLPRLFGVDISGRVDASELILRRPSASEPVDEKIMSYVNGMLGYAYGYATQFAYGASLMATGEYSRGADKMLPAKQLRDLFKAYRYETEGATNKSGDVLVKDVTTAESVTQAIGFTPARIADRYEANSAIKYRKTLIEDEKKKILDKAWKEYRDGKVSQETRQAATEFNKKYSGEGFMVRIDKSNLSKRRSDRSTVNGIYVPRKQREILNSGRFANEE